MADLNLPRAKLVSLAVQTVLYGVYLVFFTVSLCILLSRQRQRKIARPGRLTWVVLVASIVLFLLVNAHWVLQLLYGFEYFANSSGRVPQLRFHIYVTNPLYVAAGIVVFCEALIADITMMLRLYHVWGGDWRVLIPPVSTFVLALIAAGNTLRNILNMLRFGNDFFEANLPWAVACCSLEMGTNFIVTGLIAFRILSVERLVQNTELRRSSSAWPVLLIIIESAGIFTIIMTIVLVSFLARRSAVQLVALDAMGPAIGIAFSLIVIRVTLRSPGAGAVSTALSRSIHFGSAIRHAPPSIRSVRSTTPLDDDAESNWSDGQSTRDRQH